jgi:hypothetical protein
LALAVQNLVWDATQPFAGMIADKYGAGRVLIGGTILHGMGLLWLSTAPPTNGIVAQIFGVRPLAMLSGFTFLSHQIGSLLGA